MRKKLLAVCVLLLVLGLCLCLFGAVSESEPERIRYTVSCGDTIWSIATENCPDMNTEKAVYLIRQWNGCGDCVIHAGDVLEIPKGGR